MLKAQVGEQALIIVTAQSLLQRTGDTTYPFRQDSNFLYFTGIVEPDVVLVMAADEEFLILPKRSHAEVLFGGDINCDEIAKISGVTTIYSYRDGWERYKKLQQSRKKFYTLNAVPAKVVHTDSFYTNPARRQLQQKIKRIFPGIEGIDIRPQLMKMRMIKQPAEIEALKKAISITRIGFEAAKKLCSVGRAEYEIEATFDHVFKNHQAVHGYGPIIAGGKNAVKLHYIHNDTTLKSGDLLLMDVGAEYSGYSADITRTYAVGEFSDRQQAIYDAVKRVQASAALLVKPGLAWQNFAEKVDKNMGEELIELGLITENTRSEVRRYFGHGIGHSLGLDVHDVCDYDVFHKDMVITIEPGIYVPEEGIGVRIEDNYHITETGVRNLSEDIAYE